MFVKGKVNMDTFIVNVEQGTKIAELTGNKICLSSNCDRLKTQTWTFSYKLWCEISMRKMHSPHAPGDWLLEEDQQLQVWITAATIQSGIKVSTQPTNIFYWNDNFQNEIEAID